MENINSKESHESNGNLSAGEGSINKPPVEIENQSISHMAKMGHSQNVLERVTGVADARLENDVTSDLKDEEKVEGNIIEKVAKEQENNIEDIGNLVRVVKDLENQTACATKSTKTAVTEGGPTKPAGSQEKPIEVEENNSEGKLRFELRFKTCIFRC